LPEPDRLRNDLLLGARDEAAHARGARLRLRRADRQAHVVPAHQGAALLDQPLRQARQEREAGAAVHVRQGGQRAGEEQEHYWECVGL
ncbi:hypothetical protein LTR39_006802, partial [Cryomyces antarcticus]